MVRSSVPRGGHVVAVGPGGNIGSHLVAYLARLEEVSRLTLVDPDRYEAANLSSQDIVASDVGRPKVDVLARRLRRIRPDLEVDAHAARVEDLPRGVLRGDVVLSGLDSRAGRRFVSQASWRLGVPWLDGAVDAGGLLARLAVYVPGPDAPCMECSWDQRDYDALEPTYPCQGEAGSGPATNAPAALGALAASLLALECGKLLEGGPARLASGRQVLIDARHHHLYVSRIRRSADCRFDHGIWEVSRGAPELASLTVDRALGLGERVLEGNGPVSLRVEGEVFVRALVCPSCGDSRPTLHVQGRLPSGRLRCPACGEARVTRGFDLADRLHPAELDARSRRRVLHRLGIRAGDILSLRRDGAVVRYEVSRRRGAS